MAANPLSSAGRGSQCGCRASLRGGRACSLSRNRPRMAGMSARSTKTHLSLSASRAPFAGASSPGLRAAMAMRGNKQQEEGTPRTLFQETIDQDHQCLANRIGTCGGNPARDRDRRLEIFKNIRKTGRLVGQRHCEPIIRVLWGQMWILPRRHDLKRTLRPVTCRGPLGKHTKTYTGP